MIKHSQGTLIEIIGKVNNYGEYELIVRDNGIGIASLDEPKGHFGLNIMYERSVRSDVQVDNRKIKRRWNRSQTDFTEHFISIGIINGRSYSFSYFWHCYRSKKLLKSLHLNKLNLNGMKLKKRKYLLILGQGSNVLFTENFNGIVLLNRLEGIEHREDDNYHYLHVKGGENWHHLVQWSISQGIFGLET